MPCIYCKSEARRVFSPVGIIFKGSGFYSTDYKSGSKNTANGAPATKDKEEKSQDQTKSEKKSKEKISGGTKPAK